MSFMDGFEVSDSVIDSPYFGIVYGQPGCGKTFFCSYAEKPFFIALEKGVEKVTGVGKQIKNGAVHIIESEDEFYSTLKQFVSNEHSYKTIVIDSGMFLDKLSVDKIIAETGELVRRDGTVKPVQTLSDIDYGKGYARLLAVYEKRLFTALKFLHKKGLNVILIAHSKLKPVCDDNGNEFKRQCIDMSEFGSYSVPNLLTAKADWVIFMQSTVNTTAKRNNFGTIKNVADSMPSETIVHTRASNGFFAKVRTANVSNVEDFYIIDINDKETSKKVFADLIK